MVTMNGVFEKELKRMRLCIFQGMKNTDRKREQAAHYVE